MVFSRRLRCADCGHALPSECFSKDMLHAPPSERISIECQKKLNAERSLLPQAHQETAAAAAPTATEQQHSGTHELQPLLRHGEETHYDVARSFTEDGNLGWQDSTQAGMAMDAKAAQAQNTTDRSRALEGAGQPLGWQSSGGVNAALHQPTNGRNIDTRNHHYTQEDKPGWMDSHEVKARVFNDHSAQTPTPAGVDDEDAAAGSASRGLQIEQPPSLPIPRLLATPEVQDYIARGQLDGWQLHQYENEPDQFLQKSFTFDSFDAAWAWMSRVVPTVKKQQPCSWQWCQVDERVDVVLNTPELRGITVLDICVATAMNQCV